MTIAHTYEQSTLSQAPAVTGEVNTPHDSTAVSYRALWVGGGGNITLRFFGDSADTLISGIPAGTLLPFAVKLVKATGTSATLIVGLG